MIWFSLISCTVLSHAAGDPRERLAAHRVDVERGAALEEERHVVLVEPPGREQNLERTMSLKLSLSRSYSPRLMYRYTVYVIVSMMLFTRFDASDAFGEVHRLR